MKKFTSIGGQALIEGIMMKSPEKTALAVRTPSKEIDITYIDQKSIKDKFSFLKIPILRGVVNFVESMIQGYKCMMISADKSGMTDLEEETDKPMSQKKKDILMSVIMTIGVVLGLALSVILFMYLPRLAVSGLQKLFDRDFSAISRSLIEQFIKLTVFVIYIWSVSMMNDIKRVFMYHGAEHKTIFCYESGLPLTIENVRKQKRFHPRCGTSFMILMILISVVFSTLVQIIFPSVYNIAWLWVAIKILMVPLICGAGYEVLKICGKYDNIITKIISAPGLWLQRLTTKEPEDDMIEIAIAALSAVEPDQPDVERPVIEKREIKEDLDEENDDI